MLVPWKQLRASWVIITNRTSLESYAHVYTCRAHKRTRSHRWAELLPRAWASSAYCKDGWPRKSIGGAHSLVLAFHFSFLFLFSFLLFFSPLQHGGALWGSHLPRDLSPNTKMPMANSGGRSGGALSLLSFLIENISSLDIETTITRHEVLRNPCSHAESDDSWYRE
jgi:hypothetical protein